MAQIDALKVCRFNSKWCNIRLERNSTMAFWTANRDIFNLSGPTKEKRFCFLFPEA